MDIVVNSLNAGAVEVLLSGRLDTSGVDGVETRFNASALGGGHDVLIDLSQVSFVSSMGIRMLLTGAKTMRAKQRQLLLVVPAGPVREVLETAALDTLIPMFAGRDEALAQLAR
jgi:anti-anti-sigma factor